MIRADIARAQAALRQWESDRRCRCPEGIESEAAITVLLALAIALDHGSDAPRRWTDGTRRCCRRLDLLMGAFI